MIKRLNFYRHGAQEVDTSEQTSSKKTPVVYGTGYRLGTGEEPSEVIQGPPRPKAPVNTPSIVLIFFYSPILYIVFNLILSNRKFMC